MLERVTAVLYERLALTPGERIVVGVSGGVDSTVLLHLLHAAGFDVHAAHVDYGLRGPASNADAQLVHQQCEALGVPLSVHTVHLNVEGEEGTSRQSQARDVRYAFFRELAQASRAQNVAVAHHADDQAETGLLHLFRGTGLAGLAGMPLRRPLGNGVDVLRPLLFERREAIEQLKQDQRQVLTLVDIAEFSYADTAAILSVPVGTVMSRLSRARQRMREILEQQGIGHAEVIPLRRPK